jgi:hypothetical protein
VVFVAINRKIAFAIKDDVVIDDNLFRGHYRLRSSAAECVRTGALGDGIENTLLVAGEYIARTATGTSRLAALPTRHHMRGRCIRRANPDRSVFAPFYTTVTAGFASGRLDAHRVRHARQVGPALTVLGVAAPQTPRRRSEHESPLGRVPLSSASCPVVGLLHLAQLSFADAD